MQEMTDPCNFLCKAQLLPSEHAAGVPNGDLVVNSVRIIEDKMAQHSLNNSQ